MNTFKKLQNEAIQLQNKGVPAESSKGQKFAEAYWNMITEFTGGDMDILSRLIEIGQIAATDSKPKEQQGLANAYLEKALGFYFDQLGADPLKEETK